MRRPKAGCVMWRCSAAREKLPLSASAWKSSSQDSHLIGDAFGSITRGPGRALDRPIRWPDDAEVPDGDCKPKPTPRTYPWRSPCLRSPTTAASSLRSLARSPPTIGSTSPPCASSRRGWPGTRRRRGNDQRPHRRGVLAHPDERATVTRIVADELRGRLPVISSIVCEGFADAAEHGRMAAEAGAVALDVMPPHHWLRFGCRRATHSRTSTPSRRPPSTWSATFIPRGLGRRTRQSSWPTSRGCRTCRHSRSGSAT